MVQMRWNVVDRLSRFFRWLLQKQGTPGEKARGLAIGIFCGCFPLFGFQTLLGITLSSLCRGNHLLAVSGTWISNPITYVPLYWLNYRVGSFVLGHSHRAQSFSEFSLLEIVSQGWIFVVRLFLGSTLVGTLCALVIGLCTYFALKGMVVMNSVR